MAKLRICNRRHTSESLPSSNTRLRRRLYHVPRSLARLRYCARLCYTCCMPDFAAPVERLIDELKHLPGIGQKTAQRLAFYLLRAAPDDALALADAIPNPKEKIRPCPICHNTPATHPSLNSAGPPRNHTTT